MTLELLLKFPLISFQYTERSEHTYTLKRTALTLGVLSTAYANIVTFNYLVAVNWQALGEVGGARRGYTEEGAECDKLPAN